MRTTRNTLFDPPRQTNVDTSEAAAETTKSRRVNGRQRVLDALLAAGENGLTDPELEVRTGMRGSSQRPRRKELVDLGLVRDSGRRRVTSSGSAARVWIVVDQSRGAL